MSESERFSSFSHVDSDNGKEWAEANRKKKTKNKKNDYFIISLHTRRVLSLPNENAVKDAILIPISRCGVEDIRCHVIVN